jgi:hypothetical protein
MKLLQILHPPQSVVLPGRFFVAFLRILRAGISGYPAKFWDPEVVVCILEEAPADTRSAPIHCTVLGAMHFGFGDRVAHVPAHNISIFESDVGGLVSLYGCLGEGLALNSGPPWPRDVLSSYTLPRKESLV